MTKFKTPVAMEVTKEQFEEDLRHSLEKLGYYSNGIIYNGDDTGSIVTQDAEDVNAFGIYGNVNLHYPRYTIPNYNPELFLAIAAMTEGDIPIKGEWVYSDTVSRIFQVRSFGTCNDWRSGQISLDNPTGSGHFHKPTILQLEKHFKNSNKEDEPAFKQEIPEEFYVRYCEGFTEDIFNELRLWSAKNGDIGGEAKVFIGYAEFIRQDKLRYFQFERDCPDGDWSFGIYDMLWDNVKTEYTLEQVKNLINYKPKTNKNEYKEEDSYERESREIKQIDEDLDSISSREGGKEIKIRTISSRNLCQRGSIESSNSITSPRGSSSRIRAERGRLYI